MIFIDLMLQFNFNLIRIFLDLCIKYVALPEFLQIKITII